MTAGWRAQRDRIGFGIRFFVHDHWQALLAFGIIAAAFAGLAVALSGNLGETAADEIAEVVRFGSYDSKYGDRPVVVVRFADGRIAQLGAPAANLRSCRIGAPIRVSRRGNLTTVPRSGCDPRAP